MDSRSVQVVAFDCDGVMFDSSEANRAFYNQVLVHIGMPTMTPEQSAFAHMHTVDESLEYLIGDPVMLAEARRYRLQMSYHVFIRHMVIEPHLRALLSKLRPAFKTAIATNRTDTMDRVLEEHDLEGQFDLVVTASDVLHPKPDPEQLRVILEHFKIQPERMIYIGDSPLDAQSAQAAHVPFIAYRNASLPARMHIQSLQQIEGILGIG
jgi:phosphoglycolate phosphatase